MALKILKVDDPFLKFLWACKNITGEHPKVKTTGLGIAATITEEIFNSSVLQWETGVASNGEAIMSDDCPHPELTWSAIQTEMDRLQAEWDAKEYQRLRRGRNEYPTVEELVVALYEPEDRADIDARRLATKQKFPKP